MTPKYPFFTAIFLFVFAGCNLISSDSDEKTIARVQAMEENYTLDAETSIGLKLRNVSSQTIYYSTCGSGTIEEMKGLKVHESVMYVNTCYCICIVSIEPGKEKQLYVSGYLIDKKDELQFSSDFRYKVFPHFYKDQALEDQISVSAVEMTD